MGGGRDSSLSTTNFLQETFFKTNDPITNVRDETEIRELVG